MDIKAVNKAKARLEIAQQQLERAKIAKNHSEFAGCWYLFLVASKNVYTMLEQGAKVTPQSRQWFALKKNERRNDALLQYLFQARDDDEHGINETTKMENGFIGIGRPAPGYSNHMQINFSTDSVGNVTIHEATSFDGKPILIEEKPPHPVLVPVTSRGHIIYHPPWTHLGEPLFDNDPITVGALGPTYLERLVADAMSRAS